MNQILDEARRAKRRPQHVELDPELEAVHEPSPLEQAIGREQMARYEAAMAELEDSQREAIVLRLEMGMRYRDIAEATGISSAEAVRAQVGRGMVRLARSMRDRDRREFYAFAETVGNFRVDRIAISGTERLGPRTGRSG